MDNLKDFTKAEFLSFLYAEKSREIENNSVPGWSKWALLGTIATVLIFLYNTIKTNYSEYNINCLIEYLILLFGIILLLLNYYHIDNHHRTYIPSKVRPLKEEAPVLSCVFQFAICTIGSIIQFHCIGNSVIFWNIIVALAINLFILIYIITYRNRYVLAQLRTRIFINDNINFIVRYFLGWAYMNILAFSILNLIKSHETFHPLEFELAIGLASLILLLYLFLKIKYQNKNIAEGLDRLIEKFAFGSLSQEETYRQYILMVYGFSAYQTIEKDIDFISTINNHYDQRIQFIHNINDNISTKTLSIDDCNKYLIELQEENRFCIKSIDSNNKLLAKIGEICKLGIPAIVDAEFNSTIEQSKKSISLLSEIQDEVTKAINGIQNYLYTNYYCQKYDGICMNTDCTHRKEPASIKYKIIRWFKNKSKS
jgi:hypothetical protein